MQSIIRRLCATALCLTLSAPAFADDALDRIFDTENLDNVKSGMTLAFTHIRETHNPEILPALERNIEVAVEGKVEGKESRSVIVSFKEGERNVTLSPFSDGGGNPMLVFFLESLAKAVAKSTGGSPFYIKNRIVETFQRGTEVSPIEIVHDGKPVEASRILYAPFAKEKVKDRLQNFANMEMVFTLSEAVPGGIVEIRAIDDPKAEDGFREFIVFDGIAEKDE